MSHRRHRQVANSFRVWAMGSIRGSGSNCPSTCVGPILGSRIGKKVDVDDLVGAAEIAERLGVKRPHLIHDWRRRHPDFPQPVVELKGTLIWDWRELKHWAQTTGRLNV
jgi:hypothetical protein